MDDPKDLVLSNLSLRTRIYACAACQVKLKVGKLSLARFHSIYELCAMCAVHSISLKKI